MSKERAGFNLEEYLSKGAENLVKGAIKATFTNPAEAKYLAKFAVSAKAAERKRKKSEESGEHIPPFLISSITSSCNLHCAGCYARANHACSDSVPVDQLSAQEWKRVFDEAHDMGVSFILLAGGEPMVRKDVIMAAAEVPDILFPVFTNGTLIGDKYMEIFKGHRNLVPVISIEGHEEKTDARRGIGVYQKTVSAMANMKESGIVFGSSVTVTTENLYEVTSDEFLDDLADKGCKVVFYVEFVPVTDDANELAPGDEEREYMMKRLDEIRSQRNDILLVAFPGDEKTSGGCLAAGRGFFHINSRGGAEPCPFSPYSDMNVRENSLREILKSRLFKALQSEGVLMEEHKGGCVLFNKKDQVEELLKIELEKDA